MMPGSIQSDLDAGTVSLTGYETNLGVRADALQALKEHLSPDELITEPDGISAYLADQSVYRTEGSAWAVAVPRSVEGVQRILAICNERRIPVTTRGRGTGLTGAAVPIGDGIVLSTDELNRRLMIHPDDLTAVADAGVITARVNEAAREFGLMYAPDPASASTSSIGGNIATNAGGLHCVKYGVTKDNVLSLKVVLADGTLITTGRSTVKNVAGLDLTGLFVGSEGLLGVVVEATLKLRPLPVDVATVGAVYPDVRSACAAITAVLTGRIQPSVLEIMEVPPPLAQDPRYARFAGFGALVIVQTDGTGARQDADRASDALTRLGGIIVDTHDDLLTLRTSRPKLPADAIRAHGDTSVPLSKERELFGIVLDIAAKYRLRYTAIAHAGDGNVHTRLYGVPNNPGEEEAIRDRVERAHDELLHEALRLGGSLTGEHGIGYELADKLSWQLGETNLRLQRQIKSAFDPNGILNPGKWL
ncbi:FAD-binding oxidoreductase [Bifidobacterium vespertilionis]|uniref:FAD-binding oxidoreductase n=1 Tax=Bifidobacterium vespertilionis TaxID=2562524 RepID=UPI001BDCF7A4|nr:FAD-binding protein [Bifidobacterium vespertilionis]MBT1179810.1 FAD-binding protein [Bifidobacterium vespertilionis]